MEVAKLTLTCKDCDIASTCKKPQKEEDKPCRDVVPAHCGDVMRLTQIDGREHHYLCGKCGVSAMAAIHKKDVPREKPFADPILPRVGKDDSPETGFSDD